MAVLFESSSDFEEDMGSFEAEQRDQIKARINRDCGGIDVDRRPFRKHARRLGVRLPDGMRSSLHSMRVNDEIRLIVAVDDDPLFDRTIVTLLRAVSQADFDVAARDIVRRLYGGRATIIEGSRNGRNQAAPG